MLRGAGTYCAGPAIDSDLTLGPTSLDGREVSGLGATTSAP